MSISLTNRQIFSELVSVFSVCSGSLLALILIGRVLQLRELFLGLEVGLADLVRLFGYLGPFFLLLIIPIACMLSVFLTFLRMSTDRELVALKAGGISLYQLLPAPLLFGFLCTALTLFVSLYGLSWGMHNFRTTILDIAQTRARIVMQPGVFNQDIPKITIFARNVNSSEGTLHDVLVEDRSHNNTNIVIVAPKGKIESDRNMGALLFRLMDGKIYRQQDKQMSVLDFREYIVRLSLSQMFKGFDLGEVKPKEMSWETLVSTHQNPGEKIHDGNFVRKVAVEMHKRWALPLACFVLGLFAMPLACAFEGLQRQLGIVLALVNFLIYYSLFSVGLSTGESGTIPPQIGMWLPNGLFLVLGLLGLIQTAKERSLNIMGLLAHLRFTKRTVSTGEDA